MAKASNTINGKAFEYACLMAIFNKLQEMGKDVKISETAAFNTAKNCFEIITKSRCDFMTAAATAVKVISGLEPHLLNGDGFLLLEISPDSVAIGSDGDVRDVICIRESSKKGGWQIGLSCKLNHRALRHPRVTESKDFGVEWMDIPCSQTFIQEITPVIDSLVELKNKKTLWRNVNKKFDAYYVPILQAYVSEIKRLCDENPDVPSKLLSYFFGSNDFYKVIMNEKKNTTTVQAFNMNGTLSKRCGSIRPTSTLPKTDLPQRLIDVSVKVSKKGVASKTTIILAFDRGWTISMRLHNKDKFAKPTSLAWDVNLVGLPEGAFSNTRSWFE